MTDLPASYLRLRLCAPLEYTEVSGLDPFNCPPQDGAGSELLFCFEINGEQGGRIDPQADVFLERLVFSGKGDGAKGDVSLPAGVYLFTQKRTILNREESIYTAMELQKDGLWERMRLENRLYIRRLFEDGCHVTQFFRPVITP